VGSSPSQRGLAVAVTALALASAGLLAACGGEDEPKFTGEAAETFDATHLGCSIGSKARLVKGLGLPPDASDEQIADAWTERDGELPHRDAARAGCLAGLESRAEAGP
jgi:hypothetical protein